MNRKKMDQAKQAVSDCRSPIVAGHVNPDADCIAGMLVMHSALKSLHKSSQMILPPNTVGRKFSFMFELVGPDGEGGDNESSDLLIVLDTARRDRINLPPGYTLPASTRVCNIDHHLGNEQFGDINWVESGCSSSTQMVLSLLEALGASITPAQASLLYAGLHVDTCGFSLGGTNASALRAAAKLAELGADIGWVCRKLHRSLSSDEFKLMQLVYRNTQVSPSGRVAWCVISHDELIGTGCRGEDIDEQVAVPRSIETVKIAILFSEPRPGLVRINLRSEGDINILPLARDLGGGGHAQAAGVSIQGDLQATTQLVVTRAEEYLRSIESEEI